METELGIVVGLDSRAENEAIDSESTTELIEAIAADLDLDIYDDKAIQLPDYPAGTDLDSIEWTVGCLKTCLSVICNHGGSNFDTMPAEREANCREELAYS